MRVLLFGGTTEGRKTALAYEAAGHPVLVCVATEDGKTQLPERIPCHVGRLDLDGMMALARDFAAEAIIDATHPFARVVTDNALACAKALGLPYTRVNRGSDAQADFADAVTWVNSAEEASALLATSEGNVFLSTGSNTIAAYAALVNPERLYVRVLPNTLSLKKCADAQMIPSHILAMQGPFSAELNRALYRLWNIRHLVSKDSGDVGGVREKVLPALEEGIHVIMIRRPKQNGE